jgi:hypothetical protein
VSDRAELYRRRADECMSLAASTADPDQKRMFEQMAQAWLKLARYAEEWLGALARTRDKINRS